MPSSFHAKNVANTIATMHYAREELVRDEAEWESLGVAIEAAEDYLADLENDAIPETPDDVDWRLLSTAATNLDGMADRADDRDTEQRFEAGQEVLTALVRERREDGDE